MTSRQDSAASLVAKNIEAPVHAVMVLEDRAQVTRQASLDLPAGFYRLRIDDLSPVVVDRSLFVDDNSALQINKLQMQRRWRVGEQEARADDAETSAEIKKLRRALYQLREHQTIESEALELLDSAAHLYMSHINTQMPFAEDFSEAWKQELRALLDRSDRVFEKILEYQVEEQLLQKQLGKQEQYQNVQLGENPSARLQAWLEIDLEVLTTGPVNLQFSYTVPCAMWRPMHRASLNGAQVEFFCQAALWQNTGEDWTDVQLSFSTARSTQQAEPPILQDDRLRVQKKTERRVQLAVREQKIASTGEGVTAPERTTIPAVDDGGETRLLKAAQPGTVHSNGRLNRVALFSFDAEAELDRLCYPELDPLVHLRSRQVNRADFPLLAGPVELLSEQGYIGRGEIGFVAAGEYFNLGWGSDDALRVRRELEQNYERAKLSGKQTRTFDLHLYLSNLDDSEANFTLVERIPVSEIDKVEVRLDKKQTHPLVEVDAQGLLRWPIKLAAHGTDSLRLRYQIVADSQVDGV